MILQPHPTPPPPVLHREGMLLMELLYVLGRKEGRPELPLHTMHFLSAGLRGKSLPAGRWPGQWQHRPAFPRVEGGIFPQCGPIFGPCLSPSPLLVRVKLLNDLKIKLALMRRKKLNI